jgi:hypothetical protein
MTLATRSGLAASPNDHGAFAIANNPVRRLRPPDKTTALSANQTVESQ